MMTLKQILVATDFSESSDAALMYGRELASRFGATLHVLHVAQDVYLSTYGGENYTAVVPDLQQQIEEDARRRLHALLIDSDNSGPPTIPAIRTTPSPAFAIVDYAKEHEINTDCNGHACRGPSLIWSHGQRRRARRPSRPVSGADGASSGARIRSVPIRWQRWHTRDDVLAATGNAARSRQSRTRSREAPDGTRSQRCRRSAGDSGEDSADQSPAYLRSGDQDVHAAAGRRS